jgi:hypothetical protein
MLICCERKTLLNDWLISADKHKRTDSAGTSLGALDRPNNLDKYWLWIKH